jgi:two-component system, OmpR family, response regulator RegX3
MVARTDPGLAISPKGSHAYHPSVAGPARVLVVDDEEMVRDVLARYLERDGFAVETATDGVAALEAIARESPDLVLLDLMLPRVDGFEVFQRIRGARAPAVIMLTARGEETDRIVGLELGADDYVVKPFGFRELVARIRAVARRAQPAGPGEEPQRLGRLELDRRQRRVRVDGTEVALTAKEFDLLALLAEDPGAVFGREQILEQVWDPHWYGPTKTLDVHVASVRKKLGDPGWIETVRGVGFRLVPR